MNNSDTIFWQNCSVENSKVLKTELTKNVDTILGYPCDKLVLICTNGTYTYYFSSRLLVNSELFRRDNLYHWYSYLTIAKSLALKTIIEYEQIIGESIAIEVKAKNLDELLFFLPEDKIISKGRKLK